MRQSVRHADTCESGDIGPRILDLSTRWMLSSQFDAQRKGGGGGAGPTKKRGTGGGAES